MDTPGVAWPRIPYRTIVKQTIGYEKPGNWELAGTLQAIGKVDARHGYRYGALIEKRPLGPGDPRAANGAQYVYRLTERARQRVLKALETS